MKYLLFCSQKLVKTIVVFTNSFTNTISTSEEKIVLLFVFLSLIVDNFN